MVHGIGASKVDHSTKLHAIWDEKGCPYFLFLTPGNTNDAKVAMLAINAVPALQYLIVDKGYD